MLGRINLFILVLRPFLVVIFFYLLEYEVNGARLQFRTETENTRRHPQ